MLKLSCSRVLGTALLTMSLWGAGGVVVAANARAAAVGRDLQHGLVALTSDVYSRRQAGSRTIRMVTTAMMRELMEVRENQGGAAAAHLLTYQRDVMRWSLALLRLPLAQRSALMRWAVSSHDLPTVAAAFARNAADREAAARALAKMPGTNVDRIFQLLLDDKNMAVRMTTMDVLWYRRPTPAAVRSLWRRAIILGLRHPTLARVQQPTVEFRGHVIRIFIPMMMVSGAGPWWGVQDGPLACRLLRHWKPMKGVSTDLVVHYLQRVCRKAQAHPGQNVLSLMPWQVKVFRQAAMQNPRRVAPFLLYLVHRPLPREINNLYFNNILMAKGHFASNRTFPLELLVWLAHQKLKRYRMAIFTVQLNGGIPVLASTSKTRESRDITRITAWFAARGIHAAAPAQFQKHVARRPVLPMVRPRRQAALSARQLRAVPATEVEFQRGIKQLASTGAQTRRIGREHVERALAAMATDLLRIAPRNHPQRVEHLLQYQRRVAKLALAMIRVPWPRRLSLVRWGFSAAIRPRLVQTCSRRISQRVAAVRWLAQIAGPNTDWSLQRLLRDSSVVVRITVMDALWNRKPSLAAVQAVWRMAAGVNEPPQTAVFRGHTYAPPARPAPSARYGVSPAMQLLLHWKPPASELNKLNVAYLKNVCASRNKNMKVIQPHFIYFLTMSHSLKAAPYLLYMANQLRKPGLATVYQGHVVQSSNRTLPLVCLVILAGRKPANDHLVFTAGRWWVSTAAQEKQSIKKITAWYQARGIHAVKP